MELAGGSGERIPVINTFDELQDESFTRARSIGNTPLSYGNPLQQTLHPRHSLFKPEFESVQAALKREHASFYSFHPGI